MSEKIFKVKAVAIDDNGKGIVRVNNETIFVDNLLEGEEGDIKTIYQFGKLKETKLLKRLTSSKFRVNPSCRYYSSCGGCSLMHLDYQAQLEYKRKKVQNLLHKFAHLDFEVSNTLGMEDPYHFRNKIQVPLGLDKKGKIISGFYKEGTHQIVAQEECLIESEIAKEILLTVKSLLDKYHIPPYDEDRREGLVRHLIIRTSHHYKEASLTIVTSQDEFKGRSNLAKEIVRLCPIIKTVVQNINPRKTNVILGEKERVLYGTGKIKDSIFGIDFLISAKSFYQTNPIQVEVLYKTAIDLARLTKDDEVLDAYSGTGTIGLCLAKKVKKVTLVELVKEAVKDGQINAKINNITNAEFVNADCTKYILDNYKTKHFDVIFLDPPRKGSTKEFLDACKTIAPSRIVYVSCNPVTLARDLTYLLDKYEVKEVVPVDMFPHSAHVECITLLERKKDK